MAKAKKFDLERHVKLGRDLRHLNSVLVTTYVDIANAYGKGCRPARLADRMEKALIQLRSDMEDLLSRENPDWSGRGPGNGVIAVYYGSDDDVKLALAEREQIRKREALGMIHHG